MDSTITSSVNYVCRAPHAKMYHLIRLICYFEVGIQLPLSLANMRDNLMKAEMSDW